MKCNCGAYINPLLLRCQLCDSLVDDLIEHKLDSMFSEQIRWRAYKEAELDKNIKEWCMKRFRDKGGMML